MCTHVPSLPPCPWLQLESPLPVQKSYRTPASWYLSLICCLISLCFGLAVEEKPCDGKAGAFELLVLFHAAQGWKWAGPWPVRGWNQAAAAVVTGSPLFSKSQDTASDMADNGIWSGNLFFLLEQGRDPRSVFY